MVKKTTKKTKTPKKWFKEKPNSIIIVPVNMRWRVALIGFVVFLFVLAYVNFAYESTPLKSALWFMKDMILTVLIVWRLFDKKSEKKA